MFIKHDENQAITMPTVSLICGVVIDITRQLVNTSSVKARLNPNWNILSTLVKE